MGKKKENLEVELTDIKSSSFEGSKSPWLA